MVLLLCFDLWFFVSCGVGEAGFCGWVVVFGIAFLWLCLWFGDFGFGLFGLCFWRCFLVALRLAACLGLLYSVYGLVGGLWGFVWFSWAVRGLLVCYSALGLLVARWVCWVLDFGFCGGVAGLVILCGLCNVALLGF